MKMFTIYDTTAETYSLPITVKTTAEMERSLKQLNEQDQEHKFVKYADEHTLIEIGTFDETTGITEIYPEKLTISVLAKYKH